MPSDDPYGSNGFSHGSGFTVIADPSSLPTKSTGGDFDGWDWKQIEAAIVGVAAVENPDPNITAQMQQVSNPQSLFDAANIFYTAQRNIDVLAQTISDQAEALAGSDGPWQGQAATQFHDTAIALSNAIRARVNQLSGGSSGVGNVPNQLYYDGQLLQWAIAAIQQIDADAAAIAIQQHEVIGGMGHVAAVPGLADEMTTVMRESVANPLAAHYQATINSVVVPSPAPFNGPGSGNNNPDLNISPPSSLPDPPGLGGGGAPPGGGVGNLSPLPGDLNGPAGTGGLGGGGLPDALTGPGGIGTGAGAGGLGVVPPLPGNLNGSGSGSGLGSGKGSGSGLTNFPLGKVPAGTDLSQLGGSVPGGLGAGALGAGLGNSNLGKAGAGNLNPNALKPTDFASNGAGLMSPGEPLFPPGMSGAGAAGNQPGAGRPDSAGLLGGVSEPWKVGLPGDVGNPGSLASTPPGSPASWAAGGGVPAVSSVPGGEGLPSDMATQVPGAANAGALPLGEPLFPPGMSGAGAQGSQQAPARPDSAGLLGGVSEPWQGGLPGHGDPGSLADTPPGNAALWAIGNGVPAPAVAPAPGDANSLTDIPADLSAASGAVALPFAEPLFPPGMSGAGAQGSQQAPARPDPAGLLGGVSQPWQGGPTGNVGDPGEAGTSESGVLASWAPVVSPPGADGTASDAETPRSRQIPGSVGPAGGPVLPASEFAAPAAGVPAGAAPPAAPPMDPAVLPVVAYPPAVADVTIVADAPSVTGDSRPVGDAPAVRDGPAAADVPPVGPARPVGRDSGRLAIVRFPEDRADTSAWNVGVAEFLPLASASAVAASGWHEAEQFTVHDALHASDPWPSETESEPESSGLTVYRRKTAREGAQVVEERLPTCWAGPAPGPDLTADEKNADGNDDNGNRDEDDDDEFTMGDLLNQDVSAWGNRRPGASGVLE